jgi:hypothetical protein
MLILAFATTLLAGTAPAAAPVPLENAARRVAYVDRYPGIFNQGCAQTIDFIHVPKDPLTVNFSGSSTLSGSKVTAEQFARVRTMREPAIQVLKAWLEEEASSTTPDTPASEPFVPGRGKLAILVDLNATTSLPYLKKLAEARIARLGGEAAILEAENFTYDDAHPEHYVAYLQREGTRRRIGDVLSTIVTILRQERFEPLLKSTLERDAEADLAAAAKVGWYAELVGKVRADGIVAPELRDAVFIDPVIGKPVTVEAYGYVKVTRERLRQILDWVDAYGRLPADRKLDAKGMLPWPVNR